MTATKPRCRLGQVGLVEQVATDRERERKDGVAAAERHVEAVRRERPGRVAAPLAGDSSAPDDDSGQASFREPAYGLVADLPQAPQLGSRPGDSAATSTGGCGQTVAATSMLPTLDEDPITLTSCLNASVSSPPPT